MTEEIVRIAARGDGVTASGKHVAFGVPGDTLLDGFLGHCPRHRLVDLLIERIGDEVGAGGFVRNRMGGSGQHFVGNLTCV